MALTVLVTIYVMTLKQIEAESVLHPAVAIALLTLHLAHSWATIVCKNYLPFINSKYKELKG